MDVPCPQCGEQWDIDTLHDYADEVGSTFSKVSAEFRRKGCRTFTEWGTHDYCQPDERSTLRASLADLLGDDVDGYASMMDDLDYLGL